MALFQKSKVLKCVVSLNVSLYNDAIIISTFHKNVLETIETIQGSLH